MLEDLGLNEVVEDSTMNPEPYLYQDTLIWTMTTNGYKYLTLNLIKTIEAAKCPWKLLVVAGDRESYTFFRNEGLPVILYTKAQRTRETGITAWGTLQFQKYNYIKLEIAHTFAQNPKIKRCVYMDGDITLFKDFIPDLTTRLDNEPEILFFQCDEKEPGLCVACYNCCTGFIAWSHGHDQGIFDTLNPQAWSEIRDDQVWVNKQLQMKKIPYKTLPRELYPNGAYINTIQEYPDAFLLHYNYRVGNSKILEMKRLKKWIIPYM
jgi:hypothetical protein